MVKKWKFRVGGGVLREIPSVVGYGYFLEPHNVPDNHKLASPVLSTYIRPTAHGKSVKIGVAAGILANLNV